MISEHPSLTASLGLPTHGSTDCALAPEIATGHVLDGLKVWTCPLGTAWSNDDRVHISDCDDDDKINATLSCSECYCVNVLGKKEGRWRKGEEREEGREEGGVVGL